MMDVNNKILQELHKNIFELTNTCFVVFSQPVSFQTKAIITSFGVVAQLWAAVWSLGALIYV